MTTKNRERLHRIGHALLTPRARSAATWLAVVWLLIALLLAFVAPPLLKSMLTGQLQQTLGREVSIQDLTINPLSLTARVQGLSVKAPSGNEQFGFEQLQVNFSVFSLAQAGIVVDHIHLLGPRLAITRLADGRYDISDLLERWLTPRDTGPMSVPRFSINNIQIREGRFELDDRPKGMRHQARAIELSLPFISSMPYKADVFVLPAISATVDGSSLSLKGKSKPFAASHASELDVDLQDLDLARLQPYLPASLPLRLAAGRLGTTLKIGFSQQPDGTASVSLSGNAHVQALQMADASGKPFLSLDKLGLDLQQSDPIQGHWVLEMLQVDGLRAGPSPQTLPGTPLHLEQLLLRQATLDLPTRRADATLVQARALRGHVLRQPDGQLQWITLPRSTSTTAAPQPPAASTATDWVLRADRLVLESAALRFEDRSLSPAVVQSIAPLNLTVAPFDSSPGHANAFTLSASVNASGKLRATGRLQWQPLALELALNTEAVPLSPLQGYIAPYLNDAMVQGLLSSKGQLDIHQQEGALRAGYKGQMALGQFQVKELANHTEFLKWTSLDVGAIDFQLEPLNLRIGEIALSGLDARLILNRDGHLNLTDKVRLPAGPEKAADAPGNATTRPLPIQIAKVTLHNGRVRFSDQFVRPNYSTEITQMGGSILNLSSTAGALATLDLRGTYAGNAPVHMTGKLNPLADSKFLDLQAEISSIDLVALSPYASKYAGYNIDKGKLSLKASYKLDNGQLTADNRLFIDQLTFGDKVDSPDATQLPVHLAIALLKNNRGEIDIHLPISGSLDDPQFSMGGLIFRAIANLFVKVVTSPFTLLGSLFGDGQELSHIDFAPGRTDLDAGGLKTLQSLAAAMRERENLKLEIRGSADQRFDEEGLRRAALERTLEAEKRKAQGSRPRENLTAQDMKRRMLAEQSVSEEDLRTLANRRAQTAQSWLVEQGGLSPARLFLLPVQLGARSGAATGGGQVDFSLR